VNEGGQVVGFSYAPDFDHTHAYSATRRGGMVDLGTLSGTYSEAWDVNDAGQVVGYATVLPPSHNGHIHAVLWRTS
jgi:probable HAF family extracellular repeat protein